jgi:hypothetical protein
VRWRKVRAASPVYTFFKQIAAAPFWRFSVTVGHATPSREQERTGFAEHPA